MKPRILFLITLLCAAIANVQIVHAATFTVTNTGDNGGVNPLPGTGTGTLRQAILDANANAGADTITFSVNGTIQLESPLPNLSDNVTISGPGANVLTVKRDPAAAGFRIFAIDSGKTVTIDGLTITNGNTGDAGGGIYNEGTMLTISNSTLSGNSAGGPGGGIFNVGGGTLMITDSTLSGNSSALSGGGISTNGTLMITDSTLSGNSSALSGGGIDNVNATLTISNSTLSGNSTAGSGGGIYNGGGFSSSHTVAITNSTLSGNSAQDGGGIMNNGQGSLVSATLTISNSTLSGNSATRSLNGGAIANRGFEGSATLTIKNTILNAGALGKNILNDHGTVNSLGHNLSSDETGPNGGTDLLNTAPMLGPLQPNGGPTLTHALLVDSPAIDAGTDLTAVGAFIGDFGSFLVVTDASSILAGVGFAIQIDSEMMIVTDKISGTNALTVTRGYYSDPASHEIGAAVNPAFDQRDSGFARKVGSAVDIGAFEVQASGTPTPTPTATFTPTPTPTPSPTPHATNLALTAATGTYGSMVTLSATLTSNSSPVSGKMITFTLNGNPAGTGVTDGSGVASVTNVSLSGINAGTYSSGVAASFAGDGSYSGSNGAAALMITPRGLTVTATGSDKVYDGTTAAMVTLSDDRIAGDSLAVAYAAASFADKDAGTGKPVSVGGISIGGDDAGNYNHNTTAYTTANISGRSLTVTAAGIDKVYDADINATVTLSTDKISGDTVTASYTTASFNDKNAGLGKAVSVRGISFSGSDAGNYNLVNTTANTTASITARGLRVTANGIDKIYDGTNAATVTLSDDRIAGDALVSAFVDASFSDPYAGPNKPVSVAGIAISGADAGNYNHNTSVNTTANITLRSLLITPQNQSKTYGATFTFTGTEFDVGMGELATGDSVTSVTLSSTGAPATAPSATYPITVSAAVGSGLSNYAISYADGTFSVTKDPTTIVYTGFVEGNYLGTYAASAIVSDSTGLHGQGAVVHFSLRPFGGGLELQGCSGTVDASGFVSCSMQLTQPAGTYGITASFLGNNNYEASSTSATLLVDVRDTSLVYTGPSQIANDHPLSVSAVFTDTLTGTPISGETITFVLGAGEGRQTCTGTTNSAGLASCTIANVSQPPGPGSIATHFAGSYYYLPESTTTSVLISLPYTAAIQQPIDADGSSVFNVKRGVIPVKFTLTLNGVATCNLPPATIAVTRTAGGTIGPVGESVYSGSADNGSNFRIDSCQYIYNLSASALGVGTYRVDIIINTRVVGNASFGLR